MTDITLDIEIYCERCGAGLCNQTSGTSTYNRGAPCFRVEPCTTCLEAEYDAGYSKGHDEGFTEGEASNE